ncbi:MAG: A/G-specific adenine glycosylase [Gammaproteobacteria bacterium]|nr:A/G-specific adenine glycosylase [Gammaproteobacteria bacterium]
MPFKTSSASTDGSFASRLLCWYDVHGRRGLPWQVRCPYRRWVSEIMLQQTTVSATIPYFTRFLARFPTIEALSAAPLADVMAQWAGLGYYARARNLHASAQVIVRDLRGVWPRTVAGLAALPGIGRSTAGAIAAFAFGLRAPILDANVRRVLRRYHNEQGAGAAHTRRLWALAEAHLPAERIADYTQAIMDLGALVCRKIPDCPRCPLLGGCAFTGKDPVAARPVRAERSVTMLLAQRADGQVLLIRRPAQGIWGGLWSLPECAHPKEANLCLRPYGLHAQDHDLLSPLRHTFTHLTLHIQPVHARVVAATSPLANEDVMMWYPLDQPAPGVPAPVGRLLTRLREIP